jgi:hypothetical protein
VKDHCASRDESAVIYIIIRINVNMMLGRHPRLFICYSSLRAIWDAHTLLPEYHKWSLSMMDANCCSLCDSERDGMGVVGKTMLDNILTDYSLCAQCVLKMPDVSFNSYNREGIAREEFWSNFKSVLKRKLYVPA